MIRETSIEAYKKIKESGLLSKRRWEVYDIVCRYGEVTGSQVVKHFLEEIGGNVHGGSINGRLSELRDRGVIRETKEAPCPITGHVVIFWESTGRLPVQMEKPKRHKCKFCKGSGYIMEQQIRLF